jgi:hypothetical protein
MGCVGPEFAPLLFEPRRQRIAQLAAGLALPVQTLCLECRLGPGDERVDFGLCLFPTSRASFAGTLRTVAQRSTQPSWHRCADLLADWAERDPRYASIPFLCMAFDLEDSGHELPVPCLSFCVDPHFFARRLGLPIVAASSTAALEQLVTDVVRTLLDQDLPANVGERIARRLTGAPGIEARHMSLMIPRTPATLKLDVALSREDVAEYLRSIAWHGPAQALQDTIAELAPGHRRVQLNLVVDPLPAHAGLEVELCTEPDQSDRGARADLLHGLTRRGLITEAKRAALMALCDRPLFDMPHGQQAARNWYLKLVFDGAVPRSAKAYVGVMPRPFARDRPDFAAARVSAHQ